ncbi:MAG: PIN domain-containing protein [Candidatus Sulfotelmatobacter sp.]
MRRAVLADTGPLYAAVDPHDAHHKQAIAELRKLAREKREVVVAYPTLLEAYTMVLHRLGRNTASDWLNDMADAALVNPTPEDYRQAISRIGALAGQPITLFDATAAALATRLGLEVWTYDHHFDVMRVSVWRGMATPGGTTTLLAPCPQSRTSKRSVQPARMARGSGASAC